MCFFAETAVFFPEAAGFFAAAVCLALTAFLLAGLFFLVLVVEVLSVLLLPLVAAVFFFSESLEPDFFFDAWEVFFEDVAIMGE